eukprot:CAMPEP_0195302622 /NCGR_PEP_ID=MMETSP0707-20130614/31402_1 /TAXON_ID=33640 /ORGANISM="Asterionellopsis glacialis, Strain CCMP134" /LENGTH=399 /DNA_ID=CAMNT_0040365931 /DNA_START=73 /DNA_END=1272 /DNA_ORIENTATION=-
MIKMQLLQRRTKLSFRQVHSSPPAASNKKTSLSLPSSTTKTTVQIAESDKEALEFLAERSSNLGIPLSSSERKLILDEIAKRKASTKHGDGKMTKRDWERFVSNQFFESQERLTLADYLAKSHDLHLGQHLLQWTTKLGIAFFAMASAYAAGEAGMHIVGSTIVGCVTALGGGTFNNLITGITPVGWVRNPSFLLITVGASFVGFYVWPLFSPSSSNLLLQGEEKDDGNNSSDINRKTKADDYNIEPIRYAMESVALGALAVVGAQQGIVRGLHPLVSSALGVTITFGGIVRDLILHRDLNVGSSSGCQSYGIASLAGATVYVMLRELHVWNCAGSTVKLVHGGIPIGLRILLGFGTVFGIRAVAWQKKPDGDILLSMEASAQANRKLLQLQHGPANRK